MLGRELEGGPDLTACRWCGKLFYSDQKPTCSETCRLQLHEAEGTCKWCGRELGERRGLACDTCWASLMDHGFTYELEADDEA